jgi:hypothetical protein
MKWRMNLQGIHTRNVYVNVGKIIKLEIPIGPIWVNQFIQLIASLPPIVFTKKVRQGNIYFLGNRTPFGAPSQALK